MTATLLTLSLGCSSTVEKVYVERELPLPDKPEVPTVQGEKLECLSKPVVKKLVKRDQTMQSYIDRLRAIIKETRED